MTATVAPGAETPASLSNDDRRKKFNALVKSLGEASGKGKDALPKLAHAVTQAAADGIITADKTKKSKILKDKTGAAKKINDIGETYESYITNEGSKATHERSEKSIESQVSKLMNFYKLGSLVQVDGVVVLDTATRLYKAANPESFKNPDAKGAYEFYQDVAKAQVAEDQANTELTDEAIEALIWKAESGPKTLEGELKRAMKILENLVNGEGKDKIKDTDERTEAAFNLIKERVGEIAKLAQIAELQAKLAALTA